MVACAGGKAAICLPSEDRRPGRSGYIRAGLAIDLEDRAHRARVFTTRAGIGFASKESGRGARTGFDDLRLEHIPIGICSSF